MTVLFSARACRHVSETCLYQACWIRHTLIGIEKVPSILSYEIKKRRADIITKNLWRTNFSVPVMHAQKVSKYFYSASATFSFIARYDSKYWSIFEHSNFGTYQNKSFSSVHTCLNIRSPIINLLIFLVKYECLERGNLQGRYYKLELLMDRERWKKHGKKTNENSRHKKNPTCSLCTMKKPIELYPTQADNPRGGIGWTKTF